MLRKMFLCFALIAASVSVLAAEPGTAPPIPIGAYSRYSILPVTADFKPHRGLLPAISDRLLGRMLPLLNKWNFPETPAAVESKLEIALVIDKAKGVSGGARAMWGALAGDSAMVAHLELIERTSSDPDGKLVARQPFFVSTKASWTASGQVSDYLMYDDLVTQVAEYLSACYRAERRTDDAAAP